VIAGDRTGPETNILAHVEARHRASVTRVAMAARKIAGPTHGLGHGVQEIGAERQRETRTSEVVLRLERSPEYAARGSIHGAPIERAVKADAGRGEAPADLIEQGRHQR
jgi:hypothetical protein